MKNKPLFTGWLKQEVFKRNADSCNSDFSDPDYEKAGFHFAQVDPIGDTPSQNGPKRVAQS